MGEHEELLRTNFKLTGKQKNAEERLREQGELLQSQEENLHKVKKELRASRQKAVDVHSQLVRVTELLHGPASPASPVPSTPRRPSAGKEENATQLPPIDSPNGRT